MRTNKRVTNKWNGITSYMFNSFENESASKRKNLLVDILNLSKTSFCYAIVVVKTSKVDTVENRIPKYVLTEITSDKSLTVIALKVENNAFPELVEFTILNDERTEIYIDNKSDFDDFIHKFKHNESINFDFEVVINDNNSTYININQNIQNYTIIDRKIRSLLSIR